MRNLFTFVSALFLGGIFGYLGYSVYTGNPVQSEGTTFRKLDPDMFQDWMISNFGESTTGLAYMGLGALIPVFVIWRMLRSKT